MGKIIGQEKQATGMYVTEPAETIQPAREADFERLFKSHFKSLHCYAFTILKDNDLAEDTVQNVFLRLWNHGAETGFQASLTAYLYRAVYNESMNVIKHEKVKLTHRQFVLHRMKNETDNAAKKILTSDLEQKLRKALNELPEQCRTIFQMSRFDELKYQEIAERLSISVKTVENQMGKALKLLRLKLVDFLPIMLFVLSYF
jgi:RNA polymerase sigma-70 factor (ECF subfamily)